MNVQQTILKGIKEQLFLNDYLVLPGFGGFVLKSRPAHFTASGGALAPASKTVAFNVQLKQNDGVMAIWLQAKLNCTAAQALNHLHEFSGFCSSILNTKRRLSLDGIGFFYLDFENNVCFEPQADVNFLSSSFGLSAVNLMELNPATEVKQNADKIFIDRQIVTENKTESSVTKPLPKRNISKVIMPVILLIFLFSILGLLVTNSKISGYLQSSLFNNGSVASFNSINYPDLKLIENNIKNQEYVADANGIATIELEGYKILAVRVLESEDKTISSTKKTTLKNNHAPQVNGDFEIILGCFSVLNNANRMVDKLSAKNIPAFVSQVQHKGMHVVSFGAFTTKTEALEKLQGIQAQFPHAWIKSTK